MHSDHDIILRTSADDKPKKKKCKRNPAGCETCSCKQKKQRKDQSPKSEWQTKALFMRAFLFLFCVEQAHNRPHILLLYHHRSFQPFGSKW